MQRPDNQTARRGPVQSMTGYATCRRQTSAGELTISLRSVNHRSLDLHFYHGHELARFENEMRALLKSGIRRAHVEVRTSLVVIDEAAPEVIDVMLLRRYVTAFQQTSEVLQLGAKPDLNALVMLPGVAGEKPAAELSAEFGGELLSALARCLDDLNLFREREGAALREEIENQAAEIERESQQIAAFRKDALPYFRQRMREKLADLLGASSIPETRLVEEAAMLADRSDIHEELTRLDVHTKELLRMLQAGGEIGKRLDFLLQEMNREINTTLAKSAGAGEPGLAITSLGLAIKANIERIREQALNLE